MRTRNPRKRADIERSGTETPTAAPVPLGDTLATHIQAGKSKKNQDVPVEVLTLPVRAWRAVEQLGIKTVRQLLDYPLKQLRETKYLGERSLRIVEDELVRYLTGQPATPGWPWGTLVMRMPVSNSTKDLDVPVDVLDFPPRARNALERIGIGTVRELLHYPLKQLRESRNFGRRSLRAIESKLERYFTHEPPAQTGVGMKALVDGLLASLPNRERSVIAGRYGLWGGIVEPLQGIGDRMGVTRERARQIETSALKRLRRQTGGGVIEEFLYAGMRDYFRGAPAATARTGILENEDVLAALGGDCTLEEAALGVALLQDVDRPDGALFEGRLAEVEPGVFCAGEKAAREYRRFHRQIEGILEERHISMPETSLGSEVLAALRVKRTPARMALLRRIIEVSPTLVRLRDGQILKAEWMPLRRHEAARLAEAALMASCKPKHFRDVAKIARELFQERCGVSDVAIYRALFMDRGKFARTGVGTYGLVAWGLKPVSYVKDQGAARSAPAVAVQRDPQ